MSHWDLKAMITAYLLYSLYKRAGRNPLIRKSKIAVFLYISRTFETVNRSLLLVVEEEEVGSVVLSYLTDRKQCVKYNIVSPIISVDTGVPQGSVLGLLLFNIYVNDIVKVSQFYKMGLFVDDTLLSTSGSNMQYFKHD